MSDNDFNMLNYIDGEWAGRDLSKIEVTNPATGEVIGTVPSAGREEAERAIDAASAAFPGWSHLTASSRGDLLMKVYNLIIEHKEELARLMTIENGKPLRESRGEAVYAASFLKWFAEEGRRVYGRTVPGAAANQRIKVIKQPVGVVAAITPWNFPAAMITRKMAPALAAGCTFIVRPPRQTPLTALKIAEYCEQAGIPKGVFNVICGAPGPITEAFMARHEVRKITFTGSTEVGRRLLKASAEQIKKVSMELGGHAPLIVCDDADLDVAVAQAIASKFRNSGQTCVCANRIFVQSAVYDAFAEKYVAAVRSTLKVGNGLNEDVNFGPLIDGKAYEKVTGQVKDALEKGAELLTGGRGTAEHGAYFYQPTVLKNANQDMEIMHTETFGPVAPIQKFETIDEAIRLANDTPYGLAAYFFTKDVGRGTRLSEELEYGIVGWNDGLPSTAEAPFGGVKQSGLGREGGSEGIEEYLEHKYISLRI